MSATAEKITYTATPDQIERMHQAFDDALAQVGPELGQTYPMLINGVERTAAKTFEVRSPIDRSIVIGRFQKGTKQDVDDAVAAARAAFPAWAKRPYKERVA